MNKIQEWSDDFSFLDDDDRLVHLIDLAKSATSLPEEMRTDDRLVNGCMSKIWVDVGVEPDTNLVNVYYDSDAIITKGITRVVCDCFSGITIEEAKSIQPEDFANLGIKELLSAVRRNGLGSLISTIANKIQQL